ncbi:MAG: EpsG family protein [Butyrivibrio sp.]|nr:EpsG family protein [Butyrivibrio sp.]
MNVYLIIILVLVLCVGSTYEILTYRSNYLLAFISLCFFVICIATRSPMLSDTRGYIEGYNEISFTNMQQGDMNIGFIILVCIFKALRINVRFFFGFIAILNYCIAYYACKNFLKDCSTEEAIILYGVKVEKTDMIFQPCVFSALFIPYFGIYYSGEVLRGGIAISFILLSYLYLCRRNYFAYILFIVIAMLFHSSAILGLLLIICDMFTVHEKKKYLILWGIVVAIWISKIGFRVIQIVPIVTHKLYEITKIFSFERYTVFYASAIRFDAFWGKKELFFLICCLVFILMKSSGSNTNDKILTSYFLGVFLAFAVEYIMNSYRIVDFFLIFFVTCAGIYFMRKGSLHLRERKSIEIIVIVVLQVMIALRRFVL